MFHYAIKIVVTALIVVAVSELAKRQAGFAALLAALPLTSLLAFVWLHAEGVPNQAVADLAGQIFWLVIPSLVLFLAFAFLLRHGVGFWLGLAVASGLTVLVYLASLPLLRKFGVTL
ncbi:MAG: DUF3147 family protein [Gallionellaceae bacterium]|nr:DUF3147 family protein [Gallionellaceae bacterium]